MPIILQLFYEDGSSEVLTYPAEIWNKNNELITKLIILEKPIASIILDPRLETADVDLGNNFYPPKIEKSRFQLFKDSRDKPNPMREQRAADSEASGGEGGEQ